MSKSLRIFFLSSGVLLLFTAAAKLISSFGHGTVMLAHDPLTGLAFRHLFRVVAILEIIVAMSCLMCKRVFWTGAVLGWMALVLLGYRIGLALLGYHKPCNCMGTFTEMIHMSPEVSDMIMKVLLGGLLAGSFISVAWAVRNSGKSDKAVLNVDQA